MLDDNSYNLHGTQLHVVVRYGLLCTRFLGETPFHVEHSYIVAPTTFYNRVI